MRPGCRAPRARRGYVRHIDTRTYVLDTSVLLADPAALGKFEEHDVVIPLVVLMELEAKRLHPELGWSAREALRYLERLRTDHGTLTEPIVVNDAGGTARVELNHIDTSSLPQRLLVRRRTTTASWPSGGTWPTRAWTSPWSARTCRCG